MLHFTSFDAREGNRIAVLCARTLQTVIQIFYRANKNSGRQISWNSFLTFI